MSSSLPCSISIIFLLFFLLLGIFCFFAMRCWDLISLLILFRQGMPLPIHPTVLASNAQRPPILSWTTASMLYSVEETSSAPQLRPSQPWTFPPSQFNMVLWTAPLRVVLVLCPIPHLLLCGHENPLLLIARVLRLIGCLKESFMKTLHTQLILLRYEYFLSPHHYFA